MNRCVRWLGRGLMTCAMMTMGCEVVLADETSAPIPVETFFKRGALSSAKLSPSGRWLAVTAATPTSRRFLAVSDLEGDKQLRSIAGYKDVDIQSFDWVNDERLVFNTIDTQRGLNDQSFGAGLFSIRRDGTEMRELIRRSSGPEMRSSVAIESHKLDASYQLQQVLRDGSDDVIVDHFIGEGARNDLRSAVAMRLNVATGAIRSVSLGGPDRAREWIVNRRGEPRVAVTNVQGLESVYWKSADRGEWRQIASFQSIGKKFTPLAVDNAGTLYVADATRDGMAALTRFDFTTGKPSPDLMIRSPDFDLNSAGFVFDREDRLVGVHYESDANATVWFTPYMKAMQAMVDERFPGHVNTIRCNGCDEGNPLLVFSHSDTDPGAFFVYQPATKTWTSVGRVKPEIDPARMATLDIYRTKARDGEDLPIWVTMPRGKSERPRAAVVLVHGGPWVRGVHWGWNPEAQFLASRGYVVIEPEFRGSTGYGDEHFKKGFGQWGLTMEDDLVDSVRWAAGRGMIDPDRVCIAGASYGGYAVLMGLVRDPQVFKCGVSWVAVTDPRLLFDFDWMSDSSTEVREYSMPIMVGDPVKDAAKLRDAAPIEHAKEIKAPLLLAFGENDRRVPLKHGTRMVEALREAGAKPEYVVYEGEGHGFLKTENNIDFYSRVERFLAANLH